MLDSDQRPKSDVAYLVAQPVSDDASDTLQKPGTCFGVDALVDVTGVFGNAAFGIALLDEDRPDPSSESVPPGWLLPDSDDVLWQLIQVDRLDDGFRGVRLRAQTGVGTNSFPSNLMPVATPRTEFPTAHGKFYCRKKGCRWPMRRNPLTVMSLSRTEIPFTVETSACTCTASLPRQLMTGHHDI